jgi:hypothetical protein
MLLLSKTEETPANKNHRGNKIHASTVRLSLCPRS